MDEERLGTVEHYYPKAHAAVVRVDQGDLRVGDVLHIRGHSDDLTLSVRRIEIDHRPVPEAHAGQSVGVQCDERVHEHSQVYVIHPETPSA